VSKAMPKRYDLAGNIIAHEAGELTESRTLHLFSHLVRTGLAWTLQGAYGRAAVALIENGYLDTRGAILKNLGE
jgi:hypothetical protein